MLGRVSLHGVGAGLLAVALGACENSDLGVVDNRGTPPVVSSGTVTPAVVDLKALTPVNGRFRVVTDVTLTTLNGQQLAALAAHAELYPSNSSSPVAVVALKDDGRAPDAAAGDGIFSGRVEVSVTKAEAGQYRMHLFATDDKGFASSTVDHPFLITRNNAVPVLSNLVAPDTVILPTTGSLPIRMSVAVRDSDGLADVTQVYFRSLDSSTPDQKIFLRDDGGQLSGDAVAGDGIFSIIVSLSSQNTRRTYRFAFQAQDTFADTSATLLHYLTVR